jgi:hypothetical protein
MLSALSVYHEMECRGVANVIGAADDAHPIGERQGPIGWRRLNGLAWWTKKWASSIIARDRL